MFSFPHQVFVVLEEGGLVGRGNFYSGPPDKESFSLGGLWCEFDPQPRGDETRGRPYEQACKKGKEVSSP